MENQTEADGGRTDNELTAADVLANIETQLADSDKVELSDEQMEALDIWGDATATRQATLSSRKAVDPVGWRLYDLSEFDGYGRGDYLSVEVHDKQQGERYTRPYATGIGQISFESAGAPSVDELREAIADAAERHGVEMLTDEQLDELQEELERADVEYADIALTEDVWAAAFDGSTLWIEPNCSRTEGFGHLFSELGLTDDQERLVKDVAFDGEQPRHVESTTSFGFAVSVSLEA